MTGRLADIGARIDGIRELDSVINAMRGIAGARARQAREVMAAVALYAESLSAAISRALAMMPESDGGTAGSGRIVVLFLAEQGFAGAFSERLLDALGDLEGADLFLVGTRGTALAAERGIHGAWREAMPARALQMPLLADRIARQLYPGIAKGKVAQLEAWFAGDGLRKRQLFPLDRRALRARAPVPAPLMQLPPATLLAELTADYIHAQFCDTALRAFAAENEARMEAMASAHREIGRQLARLEMQRRIVRQDEITAEIIELAAGEVASRVDQA